MTRHEGPVYEVTFFVDQDVVSEFDTWLEDRVRESLRDAAVFDCRVFTIPGDDDGRSGRVCQTLLETDEAVDDVIANDDIEADAVSRFGDTIAVSSRVLREDRTHDVPNQESPECLNCGTRLRGQYCGNCGQRSRSRLISLWELVTDAFGDLFELDSRLWQTLVPLVIRPGRLTYDYLQGRRARFMPPFRTYLVLSLVFFLVAFFDPREELGLLFEPQEQSDAEKAADGKQELLEELAEEGLLVDGSIPDDLRDELPEEMVDESGSLNLQIDDDGGTNIECDVDQSDVDDLPGFLARRLTVDRMQHICERVKLDEGRAFLRSVVDNVPAALIVLLPIMALVLKALYPLSRRYYVEHLLFFVHFHAFFFLILTLQILFARLSSLVNLPETPVVLTLVVTSIYIPIYLFVAMRKVYGQGRFVTFLKFVLLTVTYFAGFTFTMIGALLIAAFSI